MSYFHLILLVLVFSQAGPSFDVASGDMGRTADDMRTEMAMLLGNQPASMYGYRSNNSTQYYEVRQSICSLVMCGAACCQATEIQLTFVTPDLHDLSLF